MKKLAVLIGLITVFALAPSESYGQSRVNVRFARGQSTGSYNGAIRGRKYIDYALKAKEGQILSATLSNNKGAPVYFNVIRLGSEVAISDEARQCRAFKGALPEDGTFVVRVYMEKADRLRNRPASYRIRFRIESE